MDLLAAYGIVRDPQPRAESGDVIIGRGMVQVSGSARIQCLDSSLSAHSVLQIIGRSNNPLLVNPDRLTAKGE
jgi:hypothetical protein